MNALKHGFKNAPRRTLLVAGVFAATVLLSALLVLWILYRPRYEVLFSNMEQTDAAMIANQLNAMGVQFKTQNDGKTILVEESMVSDTRLGLASSMITSGKQVGFELFDDADFGLTDFAQKVNYQRALEGELARTIASNKIFSQARVHLSLPEKRSFQRDTTSPTAAVTVTKSDGTKLTYQQVIGIQRLVSSSVPDLKQQNVTVLDNLGRSYERSSGQDDLSGEGDVRLAYQAKLEASVTRKIDKILLPVFGKNSYQISVNTELDFTKTHSKRQELTSKEQDSNGFLKRRIEKLDESKEPKVKDSKNSSVEEEFEYGKLLTETESAIGRLTRLTVGVVINNEVEPDDLLAIQGLVRAAVGIDERRGDLIEVRAIKSYSQLKEEGRESIAEPDINPDKKGLVESESAQQSWSYDLGGYLFKATDVVLLFFLANVCFLLLASGYVLRKKRELERKKKLSVKEREELLKNVQNWLKIEYKEEVKAE